LAKEVTNRPYKAVLKEIASNGKAGATPANKDQTMPLTNKEIRKNAIKIPIKAYIAAFLVALSVNDNDY
jgi:hypothetical protein